MNAKLRPKTDVNAGIILYCHDLELIDPEAKYTELILIDGDTKELVVSGVSAFAGSCWDIDYEFSNNDWMRMKKICNRYTAHRLNVDFHQLESMFDLCVFEDNAGDLIPATSISK